MRVELRWTQDSDCRQVWEWQQAPGIREFSGTKEPPSWIDHQYWWYKRMQDHDAWFWIIVCDGEDCGYLRYDRKDGKWIVSILVKKEKQNLGIGTEALKIAQKLTRGSEVVAEIDVRNTASIKIFEKAGFRKNDGIWVGG